MSESSETKDLRNPKDPLPFGVFALFTPDEAMEKDQPPRLKLRGLTILVCAALLGVMWGLTHSPDFVEQVYARGLGYGIARGLGFITGFVPTSVAEICLFAGVLYLLVPFAIATVHVLRRKRRILNAVAAGFFRFWAFAAIVLTLFYLSWGMNYAREPLPKRLGWKSIETPSDDAENEKQTREIARLAEELVHAANENYTQFAGGDDFGRPSFPPANAMSLEAALDGAYERVQKKLSLEAEFAVARAPAKPVASSILMNYLGIGGFYFPWTGEANYNRLLPAPMLPHTVAHEKAHQRGITSEDEAIRWLDEALPKANLSLTTVHAFSSCPIGERSEKCAADSFGKLRRYENLYVNDASVLPDSPGVNPQGSVMAFARRNALHFIDRLS